MKRNDQLAAALERLLGAAESFAAEMRRGDCVAVEWRRDYGFTLALESARRALAHHHASPGAHRAPAEALLAILERRKPS